METTLEKAIEMEEMETYRGSNDEKMHQSVREGLLHLLVLLGQPVGEEESAVSKREQCVHFTNGKQGTRDEKGEMEKTYS